MAVSRCHGKNLVRGGAHAPPAIGYDREPKSDSQEDGDLAGIYPDIQRQAQNAGQSRDCFSRARSMFSLVVVARLASLSTE